MANWPNIAPPTFSTRVNVVKPAIRSRSEAGYLQSRSRFTVAKDHRQLVWNALSDANFATLRAFFIANQGGSFNWSNQKTGDNDYGVVRVYTFADDDLSFVESTPGYKSGTVNIEEV